MKMTVSHPCGDALCNSTLADKRLSCLGPKRHRQSEDYFNHHRHQRSVHKDDQQGLLKCHAPKDICRHPKRGLSPEHKPRNRSDHKHLPTHQRPITQCVPTDVEYNSNDSDNAHMYQRAPLDSTMKLGKDSKRRYERRPRHKTKPDKYELKPEPSKKRSSHHKDTRHRPKRQRRRKSGIVLNNEFKAPNVPQERLTLKPNSGPGIFSKGKASSPVQRRGLPDLTFSEMTFLTKRREMDDARYSKLREVQPHKNSKKSGAQEISDFFSRPAHERAYQRKSSRAEHQQQSNIHMHSPSPPKSSPAKLQTGKPLSTISGNRYSMRAKSSNSLGRPASKRTWSSDKRTPAVQHFNHHSDFAQLQREDVDNPTSYYSWSVTSSYPASRSGKEEAEPQSQSHDVQTAHGEPLSGLDMKPAKDDAPADSQHLAESGSVSNKTLEHLTHHALLREGNSLSDRLPHATRYGGHYTLDDLKKLARIPDLRATSYSTLGDQPQVDAAEKDSDNMDATSMHPPPPTRLHVPFQENPGYSTHTNYETEKRAFSTRPEHMMEATGYSDDRITRLTSYMPNHAQRENTIGRTTTIDSARIPIKPEQASWILGNNRPVSNTPLYAALSRKHFERLHRDTRARYMKEDSIKLAPQRLQRNRSGQMPSLYSSRRFKPHLLSPVGLDVQEEHAIDSILESQVNRITPRSRHSSTHQSQTLQNEAFPRDSIGSELAQVASNRNLEFFDTEQLEGPDHLLTSLGLDTNTELSSMVKTTYNGMTPDRFPSTRTLSSEQDEHAAVEAVTGPDWNSWRREGGQWGWTENPTLNPGASGERLKATDFGQPGEERENLFTGFTRPHLLY